MFLTPTPFDYPDWHKSCLRAVAQCRKSKPHGSRSICFNHQSWISSKMLWHSMAIFWISPKEGEVRSPTCRSIGLSCTAQRLPLKLTLRSRVELWAIHSGAVCGCKAHLDPWVLLLTESPTCHPFSSSFGVEEIPTLWDCQHGQELQRPRLRQYAIIWQVKSS